MTKLARREFLKNIGIGIGAGISSQVFFREALAASDKKNFILYIHCGSWDGIASGLLQPQSANRWPRGCFIENAEHEPGGLSTEYSQTPERLGNPLVGRFISANNHIFSHYASPLAEISKNLLHVTCAPGSLDHNVARLIQQTGSPSGQPHWVSGLAQVFKKTEQCVSFVINSPLMSGATVDVSSLQALDLNSFRGLFRETVFKAESLPATARDAFAEASQGMFDVFAGPSLLPNGFKTTFNGTLNSIIHGVSGISDDTPAIISLKNALSQSKLSEKIRSIFQNNDSLGIENANFTNRDNNTVQDEPSSDILMQQFILAGALISSSNAQGMVIQMPGEDRHLGGAEIFTSRLAGNLWTQLNLFWKWLEREGLHDRVTIVVTHEFSRTPWNRKVLRRNIVHNGNVVSIAAPGRDHHPVNGLYVLNSRIKSGTRFGGIGEGIVATGSASLGGAPDARIPAPTTQQALGTIFLSLFDELKQPGQANSARRVRNIWPTFADRDVIEPLREIV